MSDETMFSLQVILKERIYLNVMHFPATRSPSQKRHDLAILYEHLLVPPPTQRDELIGEQQGEGADDEKGLFAAQFLDTMTHIGAEAMALLVKDEDSIIFLCVDPEAAPRNRADMALALRKIYPSLTVPTNRNSGAASLPAWVPSARSLSASLPFFVQFRLWSTAQDPQRWATLLPRISHAAPSLPEREIVALIAALEDRRLLRSKKYLLTPSAWHLLMQVHHGEPHGWIDPSETRWLEFFEPKETPFGQHIRGVYLFPGVPSTEMALVSGPETLPILQDIYQPHRPQWNVLIVSDPPEIVYHFRYEMGMQRYCYGTQWRCPTQTCLPLEPDERDPLADAVAPCASCQQATQYWSGWLWTCMRMLRGDYALTPEAPIFQDLTIPYEEEVMQLVGKGKNRRRIKGKKTRDLLYTVISYEVSIQEQEHPQRKTITEKRANWLSTTPKEEIVYERRHIEPFERHYLKQPGTYTVKPNGGYDRYVPLLKRDPKTAIIRKVTARAYEDQSR